MTGSPGGDEDQGLRLDELARDLPLGSTIAGDPSTRVRGVRHDSREVEPGDLFVARPGARADGTRFVADAVARGAVAVMATRGAIRLRLNSTASIASGMPWPRIFSEPYFAISPTMSPPTAGTRITQAPRWFIATSRWTRVHSW